MYNLIEITAYLMDIRLSNPKCKQSLQHDTEYILYQLMSEFYFLNSLKAITDLNQTNLNQQK